MLTLPYNNLCLLIYPIMVVSKQGFALVATATDDSGSFAISHAASAG